MSAPTSRTRAALGLATVLVLSLTAFVTRHDAAPPSPQEGPFPVEYYYKVRWGHFEEWLELYIHDRR